MTHQRAQLCPLCSQSGTVTVFGHWPCPRCGVQHCINHFFPTWHGCSLDVTEQPTIDIRSGIKDIARNTPMFYVLRIALDDFRPDRLSIVSACQISSGPLTCTLRRDALADDLARLLPYSYTLHHDRYPREDFDSRTAVGGRQASLEDLIDQMPNACLFRFYDILRGWIDRLQRQPPPSIHVALRVGRGVIEMTPPSILERLRREQAQREERHA